MCILLHLTIVIETTKLTNRGQLIQCRFFHCAELCRLCSLTMCVFLCSESNLQEDLFDQILLGRLDFPSPYWDNITDSAKVGTTDAHNMT